MHKFFSILFLLVFSVAQAELKPNTAGKTFQPFTGKILGYKVRLRTKPDLESHIIAQLSKNDLLLIVGEENDFWKVKPSNATKAFVFRSYILDDLVEANRVNIRLSPNTDAPIIGQLQKGDKIKGEISEKDHKWLEITPPEETTFYIAKEFVGYAGTKSYFTIMNKKKEEVKDLLNTAYLLTEKECKKSFDQMSSEEATSLFEKIIEEYAEFDEFVLQAKEGLTLLKDSYLQKKIAFLEQKANITSSLPKKIEQSVPFLKKDTLSIKMTPWNSVETSLFQKWSTFHPNKTIDEFYSEQKVNSIKLTGVVRRFDHKIKNKPGNFILEGKDSPIGYLYSTMVDLDKYVDKEVSIHVSPRSNHYFAFPAYFVIETIK